jgi:hypothetical protein
VTPLQPADSPATEPIPATIHNVTTLTAHDVAIALDGIRDAVSGLTETIEVSQATVSAYQSAILEEKHNVVIVREQRAALDNDRSDVISLHSTSSEEVETVGYTVASFGQHGSNNCPTPIRSIVQPGVKVELSGRPGLAWNMCYDQPTGSQILLSSSSSDHDMNVDDSGSESSSSRSASPQSLDEDEDSDSMVSSGGLMNTSDEEE